MNLVLVICAMWAISATIPSLLPLLSSISFAAPTSRRLMFTDQSVCLFLSFDLLPDPLLSRVSTHPAPFVRTITHSFHLSIHLLNRGQLHRSVYILSRRSNRRSPRDLPQHIIPQLGGFFRTTRDERSIGELSRRVLGIVRMYDLQQILPDCTAALWSGSSSA